MISEERRKEINSMINIFKGQEKPLTPERYPQRMCAMLAGICEDILKELDELKSKK
jgi:hypothetical protein